MQKQNVSAPAAIIVIVIAMAVFFAIFSKPAPETPELSKPVPYAPDISTEQQTNARKGVSPLGINVLFPPLPEDRMKTVRVAVVRPNGPGGRAGLRPGDAITSFNGQTLTTGDGLTYLLTKVKPDQTYAMKVVRTELDKSGKPVQKTLNLTVTGLKPLPPEEQVKF